MYNDLFDVLDAVLKNAVQQPKKTVFVDSLDNAAVQTSHPKVFGFWCPEIKRVTFNGDTTIVICNCEASSWQARSI